MSCYSYQERLNLFLKWSSVYVYKVIRTQLNHFWLLFNAFLILHIAHVVLFLHGVSNHLLGLAYADKLHFIFTLEIITALLTICRITNLLSLRIKYTSSSEHDCILMAQILSLSTLCGCLYKIYLSPQVEVFFFFFFFLNQCASLMPIRTKISGVKIKLTLEETLPY